MADAVSIREDFIKLDATANSSEKLSVFCHCDKVSLKNFQHRAEKARISDNELLLQGLQGTKERTGTNLNGYETPSSFRFAVWFVRNRWFVRKLLQFLIIIIVIK
jgi:hypothetical protein